MFSATAHAAGWSILGSGEGTGEKPQSKLWYNDGTWRAIIKKEGHGLWFYEFDGTAWHPSQFVDAELGAGGAADVKWNGTELFVLSYSSHPKLFKYTYDRALRVFNLVTGFPVTIPIATGSETMVLDQDSTGRLWAAYEADHGQVFVCWSTSADHRTWNTPGMVLRSGISDDDIASVVAFGGDKVGVFWSDQVRWQFGFRVHRDQDPPDVWQVQETVFAKSQGTDDHINVKAGGDGTVYAVSKDYNNDMRLHVRNPATGKWTTKGGVISGSGTRGIVMVSDADRALYVPYTIWGSGDLDIVLRKASYGTLSFSTLKNPLINGVTMNNCTGTKQVLPRGCFMTMCEGGGHTWWNGWGELPPDGPPPPPAPENVAAVVIPPAVEAGADAELELDLRCDEGAGTTTVDATPAGHVALLTALPGKSTAPAWTAGHAGMGLRFDGSSAYAQIASTEHLRIAGALTLEAWVNWDGRAAIGVVASKGRSNKRNYQVRVLADGRVEFLWEPSDGSNHGATSTSSLTAMSWHHVACVYDPARGQSRVYLDGRLDASVADTGTPIVNDDPLYVGVRTSSSGPLTETFGGILDGMRVWRGARYGADFDPATEGTTVMYQPPVAGHTVQVAWQSPDPTQPLAYHVYRSVNGGSRTRLTASPVNATAFTDANLVCGSLCYAVSAVDSTLREGASSPPTCVQYAADSPGGLFDPNQAATLQDALVMQAHPNPFNPTTTIALELPAEVPARLAIYDVGGRLVQTLYAGRLRAGAHRFVWNAPAGAHVASGIFFLELQTPAGKLHRKLVRVQ
jgi:hypothetical protein